MKKAEMKHRAINDLQREINLILTQKSEYWLTRQFEHAKGTLNAYETLEIFQQDESDFIFAIILEYFISMMYPEYNA